MTQRMGMPTKGDAEVEGLVEAFRTAPSKAIVGPAHALLDAVAYPKGSLPAVPEDLTPAQRRVAELLSRRAGIPLANVAIPQQAQIRRRWLGIDPPTGLERRRDFEVDGQMRSWPVWRIWRELQRQGRKEPELASFLPDPIERLGAYADTWLWEAYGLQWIREIDGLVDELGEKAADWGRAYLDMIASFDPPEAETRGDIEWQRSPIDEKSASDPPVQPGFTILLAALTPVVRAGGPLEERWDRLVPFVDTPRLHALLAALPEARREDVLLGALSRELSASAFATARAFLPRYPLPRFAQAAADLLTGPLATLPTRELSRQKKAWKEMLDANPAVAAFFPKPEKPTKAKKKKSS